MGFEPTTNGTTNRYSNRLSYKHHFRVQRYCNLSKYATVSFNFFKKNIKKKFMFALKLKIILLPRQVRL